MGETLIVVLIVVAAAVHLGLRYLPRKRSPSLPSQDSACGSGCGRCGGCPGLGRGGDLRR